MYGVASGFPQPPPAAKAALLARKGWRDSYDSMDVPPSQKPLLDISYWIWLDLVMWQIEEHRRVEKQLDAVPREILKRYEKWKDIAAISGPPGLKLIKGFQDEALRGEWQGYRSSRLGLQYRVIYRVIPEQSLFQVVHVTPHEYRRA